MQSGIKKNPKKKTKEGRFAKMNLPMYSIDCAHIEGGCENYQVLAWKLWISASAMEGWNPFVNLPI